MTRVQSATPGIAPRSSETARAVLVLNLDTVKAKNLHQLQGLTGRGVRFTILTSDVLGDSTNVISSVPDARVHVVGGRIRPLLKAMQIARKGEFDLAEVYPYSWGALLMVCLLRWRRIPVLLIARGEEYYVMNKLVPLLRRFFFRATYRVATGVIYKEIYMEPLLEAWGVKRRWLLPNAVDVPQSTASPETPGCHILYMNSMKEFRHPEILLQAFLDLATERGWKRGGDHRLTIAGFSGASSPAVRQKEEVLRQMTQATQEAPVDLLPWVKDARGLVESASIFALPADVVFLNYSLLEAMAAGVAPIIQQAEGSELIVEDGTSGLIVPPSVEAWKRAIAALVDDPDLRKKMGQHARQRVEERFSAKAYVERYAKIYEECLSGRPT